MPILLDNQPLTVPHASLAGALRAARQAAEARGRVIIDVLVDGRPLDAEALQTPSEAPLGQVEVAFTSTDPRAFVSTALFDAADRLEQGTGLQHQSAQALRAGDLTGAFASLTEVVTIWDQVRRAVQDGPALLGLSPARATVTLDGAAHPIAQHLVALSTELTALKNALAIQDWSTLADLLSGELDERASQWRQILTDLAYQVRGRAGRHAAPGPGADGGAA